MSQISDLSSVGRVLFFKALIDSRETVHLIKINPADVPPKSFSFKKESAKTFSAGLLELKSQRIFFKPEIHIEDFCSQNDTLRLFFYVKDAAYFCDVTLKYTVKGFSADVPEVINKVEEVEKKTNISLTGTLFWKAENKIMEMKIIVPESLDILHPLILDSSSKKLDKIGEILSGISENGDGGYDFKTNIADYLSMAQQSNMASLRGLLRPLEIVYLNEKYLVLGGFQDFTEGATFAVSLDFVLSPIIRRNVKISCFMEHRFEGVDGKSCFVFSISKCREEDKRFLTDGLNRFV